MLPPVVAFIAILARTPWMVGSENPGVDWWWHPVVRQVGTPLPTLMMEISWHLVQALTPATADPPWVLIQPVGW
jgi:hypothetical protein